LRTLAPELDRAVETLRRCPTAWAVAGGWAIDLFVGRRTRDHADLDIAVWRNDQHLLRACLETEWQLDVAENHQLRPWRVGEALRLPLFEIHASSRRDPEQHLELLLNDRDAHSWIFRRDPRITYPLARTFLTSDGVHFLAPELVLLYKSKAPRATDHADFNSALPLLPEASRSWLHDAIETTDPTHIWLDALRTGRLTSHRPHELES
jgi:aminoglycoside-2''-adenylyltransferase